MEFRLNKIDPEVRQRVNETTSSNRVHSKSTITVNKDSHKNKKENGESFREELEKHKKENKKKTLFVDAVKAEEVEVTASKEDKEGSINALGQMLDVSR